MWTHAKVVYLLLASRNAVTSDSTPSIDRRVFAFSITQWSCISGPVVSAKHPAHGISLRHRR